MSKKKDSPNAYRDVQFVMDLALKKPGLTYECSTAGKAINFRLRCSQFRNMKRDMVAETLSQFPGERAGTAYDALVIRQINHEGKSSRDGCILRFDHEEPEGVIRDPETGEAIPFSDGSLFDES